jgi:hypothetical protein
MWPDFFEMKFQFCLKYPCILKGQACYNNAAAKCLVWVDLLWCTICGYRSFGYEEFYLLGYNAVWSL